MPRPAKLLHCPDCRAEFPLCSKHKDSLAIDSACANNCGCMILKPGPYRPAVVVLKREEDHWGPIISEAESDRKMRRTASPVRHSDESAVKPIIEQFKNEWQSGGVLPGTRLVTDCNSGGLFQESLNKEKYLADLSAGTEQRKQNESKLPKSSIDGGRLKQIFLGLGGNCWLEFIDLKCHQHGIHALDRGLGPEGQQEQFSKSMLAARTFACENLGRPLTLEFYCELFKRAAGHLGEENRYRRGNDGIRLGTDLIDREAINEIRRAGGAMREVNEIRIEEGRGFEILMVGTDPITIQSCIGGLFGEFHDRLSESAGDAFLKLLAIAILIQDLERLHPFRNANGRTNILLMNKLLTEYGFHPAILDDPNAAPFVTQMGWLACIQKGLLRWRTYYESFKGVEKTVALFAENTPDYVTIAGRRHSVGRVNGTGNQCLFNSTERLLAGLHDDRIPAYSADQLRQLITAAHLRRPGGVSEGHIQSLLNAGMGTLADDIPALAVLLRVRIQLYVLGNDNEPWLEFDSQGGNELPVIKILHRGIHFEPLFPA
jgi:hypothetical protein